MKEKRLRVWSVLTPEYSAVEDYIDGYALYVTVQDWEAVDAYTAREAVQIAVRQWLAEGKKNWREENYVSQRKHDGLCPWTGIRAEPLVCPHNVEQPVGFFNDGWEKDHDEWWCDDCRNEWNNYAD